MPYMLLSLGQDSHQDSPNDHRTGYEGCRVDYLNSYNIHDGGYNKDQ